MDLRQLEYFTAIVKEGSLTEAAKRCRIAQPSLSQQLRALEDELGETLVLRKPRGVEPTAAGRILLEHAERVLEEARVLRERFAKRRETHEGSLVFGMIPTIAPYLLPRLLGPFRHERAHPTGRRRVDRICDPERRDGAGSEEVVAARAGAFQRASDAGGALIASVCDCPESA
jgi:DNA-binding transcriptional LysR family regulator